MAARYAGRQPAGWGMDLPGIITSIPAQGKQMALTFDACGGPDNDEINTELMNYLVAHNIPATLFLNKRWIDADPGRAEQLAANPLFELANHGTRHCPLSVTGHAAYGIAGTASPQQAIDEVWGNHERLTRLLGHPPRFFRAGTAHYDDVSVAIVRDLGRRRSVSASTPMPGRPSRPRRCAPRCRRHSPGRSRSPICTARSRVPPRDVGGVAGIAFARFRIRQTALSGPFEPDSEFGRGLPVHRHRLAAIHGEERDLEMPAQIDQFDRRQRHRLHDPYAPRPRFVPGAQFQIQP